MLPPPPPHPSQTLIYGLLFVALALEDDEDDVNDKGEGGRRERLRVARGGASEESKLFLPPPFGLLPGFGIPESAASALRCSSVHVET